MDPLTLCCATEDYTGLLHDHLLCASERAAVAGCSRHVNMVGL